MPLASGERSSFSGKPEALIDTNATANSDTTIKRRKVLAKIDSRVSTGQGADNVPSARNRTADACGRVNIGNALIYKLPQDLNLQSLQTNIALCVFFVGYIACEIPATILMKMIKPHIFCRQKHFQSSFLAKLQYL
jgi:hypothetical protein